MVGRREEEAATRGHRVPRQRDGPDGESRFSRQDPDQSHQGRGTAVHQALRDHRQGQKGIRIYQRH